VATSFACNNTRTSLANWATRISKGHAIRQPPVGTP
jgi:hypothetical protein